MSFLHLQELHADSTSSRSIDKSNLMLSKPIWSLLLCLNVGEGGHRDMTCKRRNPQRGNHTSVSHLILAQTSCFLEHNTSNMHLILTLFGPAAELQPEYYQVDTQTWKCQGHDWDWSKARQRLMGAMYSSEITPALSLGLSLCVDTSTLRPALPSPVVPLFPWFFLSDLKSPVVVSFRLLPERALAVLKKFTSAKFDAVIGQQSTQW